jgi:aspartyl-tRNA(Asn)/glutamyl-tRNA(Gln) amidotransferase subunit B
MPSDDIQVRPIIGLEIHVQLQTRTKLFCGCAVTFDAPPNSRTCPVCLGHPGTLPVMNRRAYELAVIAGIALNCEVARHTKWDRKSYYYPDMPKNYQISQFDLPVSRNGSFDIGEGVHGRCVRIRRAHLEEDAGKNIHDTPGCTLVDLNRAGTPLLEIVTEPDLASPEETYAFCVELHRLVTYLGVSEGNMKKGQMRFEPNVNVAIRSGEAEFRTPIVEIKNLNSFRHVREAVAFEIDRHVQAWRDDHDYVLGKAANENRGWNAERGVTEFQRGKEAAHDYRYFPDPDLVPVVVDDAALAEMHGLLPELPAARRRRLQAEFALSPGDADTLVEDRATADLFESAIRAGGPAEIVSKQFVNVWLSQANQRGVTVAKLGIEADAMAELARITAEGLINKSAVNQIAQAIVDRSYAAATGDAESVRSGHGPPSPTAIANELGLIQVRDSAATMAWVDEVFAANEQAVGDAMGNPKKAKAAAGFLRGQVMKLSGGKADPKLVTELIESRLNPSK